MQFRHFGTSKPSVDTLFDGIIRGDRLSLSKGITLVESSLDIDRRNANTLINRILSHRESLSTHTSIGAPRLDPAFRIGLSGPPGVGKSTFIESFGCHLVKSGHRVAVLAVDPSSSLTGGSIMGDKTRMNELSVSYGAYVRPSPSRGSLGGVARNTGEAILLCEAAGFDVVLIETVGVGQSETLVADIVDMFALLVAPGGGDELQGLKKGIVELADIVLINKADGDLLIPAQRTQLEYVSALKLLRPLHKDWRPPVGRVSSVEGEGMGAAWDKMMKFYGLMNENGEFQRRRAEQSRKWLWRLVRDALLDKVTRDTQTKQHVKNIERRVTDGTTSPGSAASEILEKLGIAQ